MYSTDKWESDNKLVTTENKTTFHELSHLNVPEGQPVLPFAQGRHCLSLLVAAIHNKNTDDLF